MKEIGTQMLQTECLNLRRFVESDAEAMFQNWASSAENLTYVTWDPHLNVEQTRNSIRNWVSSYAKPNYYKWAIYLKENPEQVIGDISIVAMDENDSSCEIGYILGQNYWGHGMMTEALKAVLDSSRPSKGQSAICQSQPSFRSCNGKSGNVLSKNYCQWCGEKRLRCGPYLLPDKQRRQVILFSVSIKVRPCLAFFVSDF
mgnify:CR=1 FL=1